MMLYKYIIKKIKEFYKEQKAATAVEFAFVIGPILGAVFILIDVGFWAIANSTIKVNTYSFYDKWIINTRKDRLTHRDIRINICANMIIIGVTCDNTNLILNMTSNPPSDTDYQFVNNLQGANIPSFNTKIVLLRTRLVWSQAFPISGFIIRTQNPNQNSIYASVMLPVE